MAENRDPRAVSYSKEYDRENTIYESGRNQPRDAKGKFRVVLARIKENLLIQYNGFNKTLQADIFM